MGIADLLSRLEGVRSSGTDRWIARCPAHRDKHPSLTVRVLPDGRVLLHDFGGCDTEAVLDAIGLDFRDLFPEPLTREPSGLPPIRGAISAREALECLAFESAVVAIAAADITALGRLTEADADRVATAAGRIASALEMAYG